MRNKFLTKILGATLGLAMAIGVGVGVANYNSSRIAREANAADTDLVFSFNYEDIPDGYTATTGTSGDFTIGSNPNILTVNYAGINTKSAANKPDHDYGYAMFLKNYGYIYSNNAFSGYYVSNVKVTIGANSGESGKIGCSFNTAKISSRNGSVNGSVSKGQSYNFPNDAVTKTYWNFSTTGANVQIASFQVTYSLVPQQGTYYTVSFNSKGGSDVDSQSILEGSTVNPPAAPTKNGYDFAGWYDNEELNGTTYDFSTAVNADFTLYAKWTEKALTANYSSVGVNALTNGEGYHISGEVTAKSSNKAFFIQNGDNAMQIYDDTATISAAVSVGNTIDVFGTYQEGNNAELKNLAYYHITSDDTTISQTPLTDLEDAIEANRFKYFEIAQVQLDSGFNGSNQAEIKNSSVILYYPSANYVNVGSSFVKNDYAANDYVSIKGIVNKYNSTIELQITYIAKLSQYTVTFESNGGSAVASQSVLQGNTAAQPANPTRASDENYDYTFAGWYSNSELTGNAYDFSTPVNAALTLYAKWNRSDRAAKDVVVDLNTQSSLAYHYSKSGNGAVDTLTKTLTGISGSAYKDWAGKTDASDVVYAGNSYGSSSAIQLNTGTTYYQGIVTTGNPNSHDAKNIVIKWNGSTTSGRSVSIYGKNEAYSSTKDLYDDDAKGSLVTTLTCNEDRDDSEYTFVADYKYIGIKASGALYIDSIDIQWGVLPTYSYSNVAIKFGGQISSSLWNRLDSESHGILGYGVMLTTEEYLSGLSIKNYYDLARDEVADVDSVFDEVEDKDYTLVDGLNIKCFYNEVSKMPRLIDGNYVWDLVKGVNGTNAGLTKGLTAVAFIRTTDDEIIFLQETTKSAAQVAKDIMDADPNDEYDEDYLEGSLANLASKAN